MDMEKAFYKISAHALISGQYEEQDLKASSTTIVSADNPGSFNQQPLLWEKKEQNGLIQIRSVDYKDHYLGAVSDGDTCTAILGKEFKNMWFNVIEDGTSNEFFITILEESLTCYDDTNPKYMTMGECVKGEIPITFEKEKPKPKRTEQKWKFTKVATFHETDKSYS